MSFNATIMPRSLYIHWPFCPYKCHFCNFVAIAAHDEYMHDYHVALCKEIEVFFKGYGSPMPIDTIFLGGGTPSTYPGSLLLDMFDTLRKRIMLQPEAEVSIEVNPGTLKAEHILWWQQAGINRISIGVQSLNTLLLKKLNRHQSSDDVYAAMALLSPHFNNISVDIIIGLPGVTPAEWKQLLKELVCWPIVHVSMYFLMVHENTPLYFGIKSNKVTLPCDDEVVDLYYWSIEYLAAHGFEQYEISNFARSGYKARHNSVYWQRKPFKAFGLGACSFDGSSRFVNEKNLMKYIEASMQERTVITTIEPLTAAQIWLEKLMLGLRQIEGVALDDLLPELDSPQQEYVLQTIDNLVQNTILIRTDHNTIRLTPQALALENEIVTKLTPNFN